MIDRRTQADRILVAQLTGEARHRAQWRELGYDEEAAAVAALRDLAGGRADLLAEVVGVALGFSEGQLDEPLSSQVAGLCRKAGADPAAIEGVDRGRPAAGRPGADAAALGWLARRSVGVQAQEDALTSGFRDTP